MRHCGEAARAARAAGHAAGCHNCLRAAESRLRSGLPCVLPVCIMLTELAGCIMVSFAAAPKAASAASVLLLPISSFLDTAGICTSECAQKLVAARRSLLASARLVLEGTLPLLSAPSVAAHGPAVVVEAAISIVGAISISALARADAAPPVEIQTEALALQQLQALLADPIAAQLKERLRYPLCSLDCVQSTSVAAQLAGLEVSLEHVITLMADLLNSKPCRQNLTSSLAGTQQQLLALSTAVARPALVRGSGVWPPNCGQQPATAVYQGATLLAKIASLSAGALHQAPSSVCQPTGLGSVLAAAAVSALAFAEVDGNSNTTRPVGIAGAM